MYEGILDQLIQQNLLAQAYGTEAPKRVDLQLENERRSLMAAEMIEGSSWAPRPAKWRSKKPTTANTARVSERPMNFNASHILVETEEEAKADQDRALMAAQILPKLAMTRSTGPSGPNGGELGVVRGGRDGSRIRDSRDGAGKGDQVSDPVQTQFGWHVIILNDQRRAEAPPLEQVQQPNLSPKFSATP